jgi:hypothetical protein
MTQGATGVRERIRYENLSFGGALEGQSSMEGAEVLKLNSLTQWSQLRGGGGLFYMEW